MEQKKYKIYFSDSKEFKIGRWLPFAIFLAYFVFSFGFQRLTFAFGDTVGVLFFIIFIIIIFVNKKFGQGELVVDGNSLSFVKAGQELGRFPLDNDLLFKNAGKISTGKNSQTTKFRIEHLGVQPLVIHFAKMGELMDFTSVITSVGGHFFDEEGKQVEVSEMQKQFATDPWGVLFNKEKREKFSVAVQDYKNQQSNASEREDTEPMPIQTASVSPAQTYRPQVSANPESLNQLKDKMFDILRVIIIIVVVVAGYLVFKKIF